MLLDGFMSQSAAHVRCGARRERFADRESGACVLRCVRARAGSRCGLDTK